MLRNRLPYSYRRLLALLTDKIRKGVVYHTIVQILGTWNIERRLQERCSMSPIKAIPSDNNRFQNKKCKIKEGMG
jgi:hypothetical protein